MKIITLSLSPDATYHCHHHSIFNAHQILTTDRRRVLSVIGSTAPLQSINTRLSFQPDYDTLLIPKPISSPKPEPTLALRKERILRADNHPNSPSDVLRLMDVLGLPVTPDIYASLVAECTQKRDAVLSAELLTHMKRNRWMVAFLNGSSGLPLLNRILLMFVVSGSLDVAHQVFEEMPHRDYISLAVIIGGLVDNKCFDRALCLFVEFNRWIVLKQYDSALLVVMVCVLHACEQLKNIYLGKVVHGWMLKMGCSRELVVATALMKFYGKCSCLSEANFVFFDQIDVAGHSSTRIWNVAIVNNIREAYFEEALCIFRELGRTGVRKNDQTFSGVLKACGRASDGGSDGKQVHANAIKLAFDRHVSVICGLADMYGRCGLLKEARRVCDMVPCEERNMACWNAMISSFLYHGLQIEALRMLYEMEGAGVKPQQSLVNEVKVACGSDNLG